MDKTGIKKKIIYIAVSMVIMLVIALYAITRVVLPDKFEQLQRIETEKNMIRISKSLDNIQINLRVSAKMNS